jgi:threonine/homoserine/homoserine lactone efflux protein
MLTLFSVLTSVKDYVEIVHKLIETNQTIDLNSYYDFGAILTYLIICFRNLCQDLLSLNWFANLWTLPILIPNIASSIISEVSVLDGYFHNLFTFLENPISYGNNNIFFYSLEKFTIGLVNSIFLCLPTSTAHIITIRRFVVQGLEAGYISGLGTIAGNIVWLSSIIFGFRFLIIPWLSLDILRYILGFSLLVKYMWDSYNEKRTVSDDLSKRKIFLLTFLLAFTEQTSLFPFLTNLSMTADSTILESFSSNNIGEFFVVHFAYLSGILVGSFSLLNFTCWFWENPAFKIYIWAISSFKIATTTYYNYLNFFFLYATMVCTICSIPYFGLDYTITNPLGLIQEDRLLEEKTLLETSFLTSKASDKNTRQTKRGRRGRNEKWKRRVERYRAFDASLYDQGIYDLFTIEDLNYGFDRFWLRRKMKRSNKGFRLFPGAWMRSFKKQMSKSQLESLNAPRLDFFRLLFEQAYNPTFHERKLLQLSNTQLHSNNNKLSSNTKLGINIREIENTNLGLYINNNLNNKNLLNETSALRKFIRKSTQRLNKAKITKNILNSEDKTLKNTKNFKKIYSKRWKMIFSKLSSPGITKQSDFTPMTTDILLAEKKLKNNYNSLNSEQGYSLKLTEQQRKNLSGLNILSAANSKSDSNLINRFNSETNLSKKDRQILNYRTFIASNIEKNTYKPLTLLHPIKFYVQKEKAFKRKLKFYGTKIYRNFQTENNAPYFRVMMKRLFYHYKPNLRWEQTMIRARSRIIRKKHSRMARKLNINKNNKAFLNISNEKEGFLLTESKTNQITANNDNQVTKAVIENNIQKPTHFYSVISKRATRYRHQIYKDVLQHWYYSPFNRLLLKLDIDSFIRRQPFSHFITKKEENLLHLRRFLLSDHYETLRWYSFMEHYETMKNNIGGTKSFASKMYNQQFQGTFKKIRHLFALTPSLNQTADLKSLEISSQTKNPNFSFKVLKFDQLLYNEFSEFKTNNILEQKDGQAHNSFLHEELLNSKNNVYPKDLMEQSTQIIRQYLTDSLPIREALIKKFLEEKNYSELSQFLWKGGKIRGIQLVTNEKTLLTQEHRFLASQNQIDKLKTQNTEKIKNLLKTNSIQKTLWLGLLKQSKNLVYNRDALKIYLTKKVNKYKKRKLFKEKNLRNRLERIEKWLFNKNLNKKTTPLTTKNINLTSSIRKAIKESVIQSGEIFNLSTESKNTLSTKVFLKRDNIYNYLIKKLKSKKLLSIYSLNKFENYIKDIDKSIKSTHKQNVLGSPNNSTKIFNNLYYQVNKITSFSLKPFKQLFKTLYGNTKAVIFKEKNNKTLAFWKAKTKFSEKKNPDRKKLSSVMPKLELQNLQDKKPRINNTILGLDVTKNDLNFYKKSRVDNPDLLTKTNNKDYKELIEAFDSSAVQALGRKKSDLDNKWTKLEEKKQKQSWKKILESTNTKTTKKTKFLALKNIFEKKFVTKSKRRTTFIRMIRSPSEILHKKLQLKRQLTRNLNIQNSDTIRSKIFELQTGQGNLNESFVPNNETIKQRKRTSNWQKNKVVKTKISTKKIRHSSLGKLKMIAKKYKKIQSYNEIRNWWWQNFLPNFKAKLNHLIDFETNLEIKNTLSTLSSNEILIRDKKNYENYIDRIKDEKKLQIGNKDYKPLMLPQAIRIRQELLEKNILNFNGESLNSYNKSTNFDLNSQSSLGTFSQKIPQDQISIVNNELIVSQNKESSNLIKQNGLEELYKNILIQNNPTNSIMKNSKFMVAVNPTPFYAGWDESIRKFVVTTRLLAKTKAGYEMNFTNSNLGNYPTLRNLKLNKFSFESAPLKGMNLATILYWKVPFSPYDQDQFFNVGIDGFAPIGWRRFKFRHSTKTIKPLLVTTKIITNQNLSNKTNNKLFYQISSKLFNENQFDNSVQKHSAKNLKKKIKRRVMQRIQNYDRSRDTLRFPSGALMNQILPLHYLNVFYKRSRLPADRYIKRRLRRDTNNVPFNLKMLAPKLINLTLRRRVKPRRRYHRKNLNMQKLELLPRRAVFRIESSNLSNLHEDPSKINSSLMRPFGKEKDSSTIFDNKTSQKIKKRSKNKVKQDSTNMRIRRLRKRVKQQIIRINPRYKPNIGGFIWPGDYLRLELKKAPKLETKLSISSSLKNNRRQQKRLLKELPLPLQPKKYLLHKHNLNVLKRRLAKSQNLNKLHEKTIQLDSFLK